jgi:hypothetical protein
MAAMLIQSLPALSATANVRTNNPMSRVRGSRHARQHAAARITRKRDGSDAPSPSAWLAGCLPPFSVREQPAR